jgi:hypothetical protein
MLRRALAFTVVVMIAAAPVALDMCQLMCASAQQEGERAALDAPEHSCHHRDSADAGGGSTVGAIHYCGHAETLPSGHVEAPLQTATAAIATVAFSPYVVVPAPQVLPPPSSPAAFENLLRLTPLRI